MESLGVPSAAKAGPPGSPTCQAELCREDPAARRRGPSREAAARRVVQRTHYIYINMYVYVIYVYTYTHIYTYT